MNRDTIHRIAVGALRETVVAHGYLVEGSWIGSAAKRIAGQLEAQLERQRPNYAFLYFWMIYLAAVLSVIAYLLT